MLTLSVSNALGGNKWTVKVGIGTSSVGKGEAYAEGYNDPATGSVKKATTKTATNATQQTSSWTSDVNTTTGHCVYTATAYDGYHFNGWYGNAGCTGTGITSNPYVGSSEGGNWTWHWIGGYYPDATDITYSYYAKFTENSYSVKFHANTGTGSDVTQSGFVYGTSKTLRKNTFTKTGYTFAGWATSANGNVEYSDEQSVSIATTSNNATVDLFAKWTANQYTVTLKPNGGTPDTDQSVTATYDAAMPTGSIAARSKTGYTFAGYYDAKSGGTKYYNANLSSARTWNYAQNKDLFAQWTANKYTVVFDKNGGSGTMANQGFTYDVAQNLTNNAFSRTGYTFAGWNTKANGTGASYGNGASVSNLTATANGTVTLYAQWSPISYTVVFDKNGGSGTMANQGFTYDVAQNLTNNAFSRTGYTFAGWNTKANGTGASYGNGASVSNLTATANGTVTLYAQWSPISYTVVFNANGGSGTMANQSFTYDVAQNLTANAFTRAGYKFGSWNRATNGSGASYTNGQSVSNLANTNGATVNLYAQWTAVTVNSIASNTSPLSFTKPESKDATVVFNVSNAAATSDFTYNVTGDGWTFVSWSYASNQVTVTVRFTCTSTTTQGNHNGTVTLTSKETGHNYKTANVVANVNLTPTVSVDKNAINFGTYNLVTSSRMSENVTLSFNENATVYSKTADGEIAPFTTEWSADHKTLTVHFQPTVVGSWEKDLIVTVKNSQAPQLSASKTIHITGAAVRHNATVNCTIADNYMVDASSINLASAWTSTSDGEISYSIESFTPSSANNNGLVSAPTIINKQLSLGQAGTLVLNLTQPETTNYNAVNEQKTITIHKYIVILLM